MQIAPKELSKTGSIIHLECGTEFVLIDLVTFSDGNKMKVDAEDGCDFRLISFDNLTSFGYLHDSISFPVLISNINILRNL